MFLNEMIWAAVYSSRIQSPLSYTSLAKFNMAANEAANSKQSEADKQTLQAVLQFLKKQNLKVKKLSF